MRDSLKLTTVTEMFQRLLVIFEAEQYGNVASNNLPATYCYSTEDKMLCSVLKHNQISNIQTSFSPSVNSAEQKKSSGRHRLLL